MTVHIVVMFTDLVGSTELSSRLDPGDAETLRQAHFAVLRKAVTDYQGHEVKNLGDGLMVTFPSASAALAGAVAVQQGIAAHNRLAPKALQVRIGISAGEAVLDDGDYFGEPVVEAARLCAAANGGQILASDLVRASAGRRATQTFISLGALPLKGLPEPVTTHDVTWKPLAPDTGFPLPPRLGTAPGIGFFGRSAELGFLDDAFKAANAGEGRRVVLISGEPGMGKTTLCAEFARSAHAAGAVALYGRSEEELGVPYQPFVEVLGHLVAHASPELLSQHVAEHGSELAALLPALARRLGNAPTAVHFDPETQRYPLFAAVVGLLTAASDAGPLVVVLDDLHWADKPTLMLLRYLVGASLPMRLLVLGTYRQSELTRAHPLTETLAALRPETGVKRLALEGLGESDVMALMESEAGHELNWALADLARGLRRETDGNPFFVTQLIRHLAERGWLYQDHSGQWQARGALVEVSVPDTVREVIGQRVSRLGEAVDRLLSTAGVIGREFDADVLASVAGLPEPEMVDALDRATGAGLLTDVGTGRYSFAHAIIQYALYDCLTGARRSLVHHRVAEALEARFGEGPGPRVGEIARHWVAAARPADAGKALQYTHWAGVAALDALAPEEAVRWFAQALELLDQQPRPDEHLRAELLIGLGSAERLTGAPSYRETLLRAAHLAQTLGDDDRLVRAALANNRGTFSSSGVVDEERVAVLKAAVAVSPADSAERARLLATLAVELTFANDWGYRRGLADEALGLARRLGDPATMVRVMALINFSVTVPETLDERLAMTADVLALTAGETDPLILHWVHRWSLYACVQAGDIGGVDLHLPDVIRYAEACHEPHALWAASFMRSWRNLLAGDLAASEVEAAEAFRIGTDSGQPEVTAVYGVQLFEIRRQQGRLAEIEQSAAEAAERFTGVPMMRALLAALYCELGKPGEAARLLALDAVDGFAHFPYDLLWLYGLTAYAEVCAALHDTDRAAELYARLAPWHAQIPAAPQIASAGAVALYLGMLATILERFDDAGGHFAEGMEIHRRLQSPYFIARNQLEEARMLLARAGSDDIRRAAVLLDQVDDAAGRYGFGALTSKAAELRP